MFSRGGVNLTFWAEPMATDVSAALSVLLCELWIECWVWCSLVHCTDVPPVQREAEHPHPSHCWISVIFKNFCIHPLHCGLVPQALRQGMLWEYTVSNYQLWNILRCLWLPEPIQSTTVLHAQRKDKTALHSKWIPHCAGNRKVPHCPAAPSHFSFCYAKSDENELDACTEHFNGTETQQYYLSVGLWEAKGPCQVLLDLEQSVSSVGMATHRYNFHASFVWGLASLQPSAWSWRWPSV